MEKAQLTIIWFDTEFIDDGRTLDLLAIGMVREDGETYYAEPVEADTSKAGPWVKQNVLPNLAGPVRPRAQIADEILEFAGEQPEFWAYFASYDWVALCQLYGTMMDLPAHWPMFCRDIQQVRMEKGIGALPKHSGTAHNALDDAMWAKEVFHWVMGT